MNPHDMIIAFDLHGVIFTLDWRQVWRIFWRFPHKLRLFACGFNIPLAWHGIRLLLNDATDVEVYALFKKYCPAILPFVVDVTNAHKPIPESVRILQKLKSRGYTLHVLSNVGADRLKVLQARHPDIMNLFDCFQIINDNPHAIVKKPQHRYFENYIHVHAVDPAHVLFIDNNKGNTCAAQQVGFAVIRFKSPRQLLCELCKRHII